MRRELPKDYHVGLLATKIGFWDAPRKLGSGQEQCYVTAPDRAMLYPSVHECATNFCHDQWADGLPDVSGCLFFE